MQWVCVWALVDALNRRAFVAAAGTKTGRDKLFDGDVT